MSGRFTRHTGVLGMLVAAAVLTSCTCTTFEPPEMQRAQQDSDSLSPAVLETADLAPDSTRLVGPWESTQVYLARSTMQDKSTCLVIVASDDPQNFATSCLSAGGFIEMSLAGHRYLLGEDADAGRDERWTELTDGVYALP